MAPFPVLVVFLTVEPEMISPVLLPALLIGLGTEGLLLSKADDPDPAGGNAIADERMLKRLSAHLPKCDVVLRRPTFVAVPFDHKLHVRVLDQECRILFGHGRVLRTEVGLVVVEVDVLHTRSEERRVGK